IASELAVGPTSMRRFCTLSEAADVIDTPWKKLLIVPLLIVTEAKPVTRTPTATGVAPLLEIVWPPRLIAMLALPTTSPSPGHGPRSAVSVTDAVITCPQAITTAADDFCAKTDD